MNQDTPIIFTDGTKFYAQLASEYATHPKGLFILAPSGSGKSYFINNQTDKDWMDGDYLWPATNADLSTDDWAYETGSVHEINRRSDVMTYQAKKLGFWIIGSSNESLKPDAIVIPPIETHLEYIKKRQSTVNSNGAKTEDIDGVLAHRVIIETWKSEGVPCFDSVEEAVNYLTTKSYS